MENGRVVIILEQYLAERKISKNKLVKGAEMERTQLQNYCKNKIVRVDLGVLARICNFLECDLSDILRYEKIDET